MDVTEDIARSTPARTARSAVVGPSKPRLFEVLGPGLISGAADDDPTAIATYCQAGARFGYGLCWLMPLVYPLMAVVSRSAPVWAALRATGSPATSADTSQAGSSTPP
jgi:hypothetical protein